MMQSSRNQSINQSMNLVLSTLLFAFSMPAASWAKGGDNPAKAADEGTCLLITHVCKGTTQSKAEIKKQRNQQLEYTSALPVKVGDGQETYINAKSDQKTAKKMCYFDAVTCDLSFKIQDSPPEPNQSVRCHFKEKQVPKPLKHALVGGIHCLEDVCTTQEISVCAAQKDDLPGDAYIKTNGHVGHSLDEAKKKDKSQGNSQ